MKDIPLLKPFSRTISRRLTVTVLFIALVSIPFVNSPAFYMIGAFILILFGLASETSRTLMKLKIGEEAIYLNDFRFKFSEVVSFASVLQYQKYSPLPVGLQIKVICFKDDEYHYFIGSSSAKESSLNELKSQLDEYVAKIASTTPQINSEGIDVFKQKFPSNKFVLFGFTLMAYLLLSGAALYDFFTWSNKEGEIQNQYLYVLLLSLSIGVYFFHLAIFKHFNIPTYKLSKATQILTTARFRLTSLLCAGIFLFISIRGTFYFNRTINSEKITLDAIYKDISINNIKGCFARPLFFIQSENRTITLSLECKKIAHLFPGRTYKIPIIRGSLGSEVILYDDETFLKWTDGPEHFNSFLKFLKSGGNLNHLRQHDILSFQKKLGIKALQEIFVIWKKHCNENSAIECRLSSYVSSIEKDTEAEKAYLSKACDLEEAKSCYNLYLLEKESNKKFYKDRLEKMCRSPNESSCEYWAYTLTRKEKEQHETRIWTYLNHKCNEGYPIPCFYLPQR